jgi:Bacterial Ig domain
MSFSKINSPEYISPLSLCTFRLMKRYYLYLVAFFSLTACSKNNSRANDTQPPVITITSPVSNQVFTAGATVSINGNMTDNARISEVHVHVYNNSSGALLIDIHRNPAAADYTLNESFIAQSGIQYKIQVIAKDNSANEGHATVEISVN